MINRVGVWLEERVCCQSKHEWQHTIFYCRKLKNHKSKHTNSWLGFNKATMSWWIDFDEMLDSRKVSSS